MMPKSREARQELTLGLLFASPFLIGFVVFTLYPLLASLYLSFCDYHLAGPPVFRGLKNYAGMWHDSLFIKACWNTLYFAIFSVPITMAVALGLALLLNVKLRGQAFYRAVFLLPAVVPAVASTVLWRWVFNSQHGVFNALIRWARDANHASLVPDPGWLTDPGWSKPALVIMAVWGMGANLLLYLAALQEVPREQYEAAEIDGATPWQRTIHVTLPAIGPVLFFTLVAGLIGSFQYFTQPYVATLGDAGKLPGGPADSALFYAMHLFNNAFLSFRLGDASALAWVMFVVILAGAALALRVGRRFLHHT